MKLLPVKIMTCYLSTSSMSFSPCNDYWRNLRKITVFELSSRNRAQSFRLIRVEEALNLVEFISSSKGCAINLSDKDFTVTSDIISRAAFGNKCKDQDDFSSLVEEILPLAAGFVITDLYPSLKFLCSVSG